MAINETPLMIGGVKLIGWEVPDHIANFFGTQKMAIHDFPGGQRTVQTMGAFPFPMIEWTGQLFDGNITATPQNSAQMRASFLNNFRIQAQQIELQWGQFKMQVLVSEFEITARMAQWLEYRIKLVPILDQTGSSNDPPDTNQVLLPEAVLQEALNNFTQNTNSPTTGYIFTSDILAAANRIITDINAALTANNYTLSQIPANTITAIQAEITALQEDLELLTTTTNSQQTTAAVNLSSSGGSLSNALAQEQGTPINITVTNPNLMVIAATYYQDQTQWPTIAAANDFQDYQLTGTYTMTIPSISTAA